MREVLDRNMFVSSFAYVFCAESQTLNRLKPNPKFICNGHESLILSARLNRDGCGYFLKGEAITSFPVARLKLTSLSNWRTARPIQFDVTFSTPVSSLKLTSLSNWRMARPLHLDVTFLPFFLV